MNTSPYRFTLKSAAYIVLEQGDTVLLLKRANTGYRDGEYSLVAGHKDEGETITECIIRETLEEAGLELHPTSVELAHVLHRLEEGEERYDFFFVAKDWSGEPQNMEPDKCEDLSWHPKNALPEETIPYIKHVLDMMQNGHFYSEYGWNDRKKS